jgi:hypothetical protein
MLDAATGAAMRHELQERGYAELEHGIDPEHFYELTEAYFKFSLAYPDPEPATIDAMLPTTPDDINDSNWLDELDRSKDTQAEWHKYRTNTESPGKPNGYTDRSFQEEALWQQRGIEIGEDPKEYFHWMPRHLRDVMDNHREYEWGLIPDEVFDLTTAFSIIHVKSHLLMRKVCRTIEDQHPGLNQIITPQALNTSPLRLIGYHHSDKPYLGGDHYDKSSLTLQLGESHEGLLVAKDCDSPMEPVRRDASKTVLFMGKRLSDPSIGHFPDSPFKPGWHGIQNLDVMNQGQCPIPEFAKDKFQRWALIYFAGNVELGIPSKADTHVR